MSTERPAAAPPLIRLSGLHKTFRLPSGDAFHAVRDVSLDVARGDVFGIVGSSGAGKSTLLRLINLLERPDHGRVEVDGRVLTALGKRELRAARQSIGMIFQQFNLLQNATVFDNVAFPLKLHGGRSRAEIAERVAQCLRIVGLADKRDVHPAQLSGGQKQRVAIARALAPNPSVLLCDEPTSALDADTTRQVLRTLADVNARLGVTIVVVTHELEVVRALCRHVAVVEHGQVAERFALDERGARRRTSLGRALQRLVDTPPEADNDARFDEAEAAPAPEAVHA